MRKNFTAKLEELPKIHEWIRSALYSLNLDETNVRKLELALEEALVNIITHGYKNKSGSVEVEVRASSGNSVEVELIDSAPPFNPVEKEIAFDPLAGLEERKMGGLGILIIRQYVDDLRYRHEGDKNRLTLVKQHSR